MAYLGFKMGWSAFDSISSTDQFGLRVSFIAQPKAVTRLHLAGAWSRHSTTAQLIYTLKKNLVESPTQDLKAPKYFKVAAKYI